jgi:large subunit ribosomal protein L22
MGVKSRTRAEKRKEDKKTVSFAKLNNCPTSPRKMRLLADMIRGKKVELALHALKNSPQQASGKLHKLLLSALANWQAKNEGVRMEDSDLFIKEISVDSGRMLKRIHTAPQGRAHRIRKRSNHVTLIVDSRIKPEVEAEETTTETNE